VIERVVIKTVSQEEAKELVKTGIGKVINS
jgi:hypothetical protein